MRREVGHCRPLSETRVLSAVPLRETDQIRLDEESLAAEKAVGCAMGRMRRASPKIAQMRCTMRRRGDGTAYASKGERPPPERLGQK
jgi:hypothetical protein